MTVHSILVVDDDPGTRKVMQQVLEPLGYAVTVAGNGTEALRSFQQQPVDLVITDLIMPEADGFELIAHLRKNFRNLEIIAISGGGHLGADTYLTIARGLGVDVVLQKPITRDNLVMAIKTVEARWLSRAPRSAKKH
jgi:CheY-like chemotaxis protein